MNKKILQIIKQLQFIHDTGMYTVFYEFFGHVNCFKYKIYHGEWDINKNPVLQREYKIKDGHFRPINNPTVIIDFKKIMNDLNSLTI